MPEPTVTVAVKRVRSLLDEQPEVLQKVREQVCDWLSKIEELGSYLEQVGKEKDEEKIQSKSDEEFEDLNRKFILLKDRLKHRDNRKFLQRRLVRITYEAEDVIDTIIYKSVYDGQRGCSLFKSKVCKPYFQIGSHEMQKIKDLTKRLEKLREDIRAFYRLGDIDKGQDQQLQDRDQRPNLTAPHEVVGIGKEFDKQDQPLLSWGQRQGTLPTSKTPHELVSNGKEVNILVEKLIREENHARVMYIVGRDGSGKTTLASKICTHPTIKQHFTSIVWADASQARDAKEILLEISRQIQGKEVQNLSASTKELVDTLTNVMKGRSYLIILDDVENPDDLATHIYPMIQKINRTKIVITSSFSPQHPYKHEEVVSSKEDADSLAEKLIMKDTNETSIFHAPNKQTTILLLQELYGNPTVHQHFDSRKWIYTEDDWDTRTVILKVLEAITNDESLREASINTLEQILQASLRSKKHLIVMELDDETQATVKDLVDILQRIHKNVKHKSKVIIVGPDPPSQLEDSIITGEELLNAYQLIRRLTGEADQPLVLSIIDLDSSDSKTTLARKLYDHPAVNQHFDDKVWITVNKEWDADTAFWHIIRQITANDTQVQNPSTEKPARLLLTTLQKKKYLLVLDGISDAEDLVFELLAESSRTSHQSKDAHKSRIIITADNGRTIQLSNMKSFLYTMRHLTEEESWELLCSIAEKHATNVSAMKIINQLKRITPENRLHNHEVLTKFQQIPLAIVVLGGLLSTKETVEEWESVFISLRAMKSPLDEVLEDILSLCYDDLPDDIKPCFLYLGLFPRHSDIPKGKLVRMLISEGLVSLNPPLIKPQTPEDKATKHLQELARRCLIQVDRRNHIGEMKHIRMHDQIHHLLIKKSAEQGFLQKYSSREKTKQGALNHKMEMERLSQTEEDPLHPTMDRLLRRTTIHYGEGNIYPTESSNLRSFVQFGKHGASVKHYYFQRDTLNLRLEPIYEHFKLLRVLILSGIRTSNSLPEGIAKLVFLTYLGLRATNIQVLPETMGSLRKLVTLDYRGTLEPCIHAPLPNILSQMAGLRHLFLPDCPISPKKTLDLSVLSNLQTLWGVAGGEWITKNFKRLSPSLVKLGLVRISNKEELKAVFSWLTSGSEQLPVQLRVLKLDWHTADKGMLQFPGNLHNLQCLHKLALIGRLKEEYNFTLLPSLVKLELFFSHFEISDPTTKLGSLPQLKILVLWNSYKGTQWICDSKSFPKLEELQISYLPNLEEWKIHKDAMPELKRLSIFNCRKMKTIPEVLRCHKLQQLEILDMPRSFCNMLQERINIDKPMQKIPYIKFEVSVE